MKFLRVPSAGFVIKREKLQGQFLHRLIEDHMTEIRSELKRLDRIEYALYNDGKTGLINKVDQLIENQNIIKVDVEVMKSKVE